MGLAIPKGAQGSPARVPVHAAIAGADIGCVDRLDDHRWGKFGIGRKPGGELAPLLDIVRAQHAAEMSIVGGVAVVLVREEVCAESRNARSGGG